MLRMMQTVLGKTLEETALEKTHEEKGVLAVGDQGLRSIKESDKNHSPIDTDPCLVLQTCVVPKAFVQTAK